MEIVFRKNQIALAVIAALGAVATVPTVAVAAKTPGQYVSGDFHNHTTCSDGSISMQKLIKKVTDKAGTGDTPWGLDWFVQAGHGGNGNRNCTLVEDATLSTPAYPYISGTGPNTTWQDSPTPVTPKGLKSGVAPKQNMWRWQSIQEFQYPLIEYLSASKSLPLFIGVESVVAGHEHASMSVISGQMPLSLDTAIMPTTPGYTALGNASDLAKWEYCFDRADIDNSRGASNNWDCSVTGSLNANDPNWNITAFKLTNNNGLAGHNKTVEALKWMVQNAPSQSYYVPAHLERAGPFNTSGANGYNIEHLRDFNNAAPNVAFGFETQPGHGASGSRGEYTIRRNTFGTVNIDSVGGTTYGGTGVYGAQIGGVWDALLGEGRNWWFMASSDWHNRGTFGPDDRRSTQDFYPGEYQRDYVMVLNPSKEDGQKSEEHERHSDKLRPQAIVDGLRSGNSFAASGQLIDHLAFIVCASYGKEDHHNNDSKSGEGYLSNGSVEALAVSAAMHDTDIDKSGCATMGEKLVVRPDADIVVSIVARDPSGPNYSPYSFNNPSLAQVGVSQPLNMPVLDHIDLIRGMVSGYKTPGAADYSGEWPRNTNWLNSDPASLNVGQTAGLSAVPVAAKNTSAAIIKTFNKTGWVSAGGDFLKMTYRIPKVSASQYVRLRGTNLQAAVPYETDANGNPLADLYTNAAAVNATTSPAPTPTDTIAANAFLKIPCNITGSNVPANGAANPSGSALIDGCPNHLPVVVVGTQNQKMVAYDVAAWSDLWFYSNPVYVQVKGSTIVAGVK